MNYKPMSDEDIEKANLIPDLAKCQAEVISAELYTGKESGKESIKLVMHVYHDDLTKEIWVFLTPNYAKLWKHAVVSMVGADAYATGNVSPSMFEGKNCTVEIGLDQYKGKMKNVITDILPANSVINRPNPGSAPVAEDDMPF